MKWNRQRQDGTYPLGISSWDRFGWVMLLAALGGFILGALVACSAVPLEPCQTETRLVAQVESYTVVCRQEFRPLQLATVTICATWPQPPDSMAWIGSPSQMAERGIELRAVETCEDTPITRTL